jgi:glycosyltransferase involved in cell wall biosynthesis
LAEPARVLHLITRLPVGGAERLLVDIARNLPQSRYESIVCCIQDRGPLADEVEAAGLRVVELRRMQTKRFDWGAVGELTALLRKERIALVHAHLYHANLYGRIAALRARVPAIATVHNTYTRTKWHRRLLNRWLAAAGARVIAVSDDIRRDVARYDGVPEERITMLQNGIDLSRARSTLSRQEARRRLGLADERFVLGCLARLEEQKGHRYLLEALAKVSANVHVLIAGDGRLRQALETQAKQLGIAERVSFLGTRRDVADILAALDAYVMPSLWEGLSLAMLEAMAAQLPVIASDVGGVSQVAADGAWCLRVPPADVPALAAAIGRLATESTERRAALGEQARRRVEAAFSLEAMLRRLTRIYDEVLAEQEALAP